MTGLQRASCLLVEGPIEYWMLSDGTTLAVDVSRDSLHDVSRSISQGISRDVLSASARRADGGPTWLA
jgi:hypothetical protein